MANSNAFIPIVDKDDDTQTGCVQVTTATASASTLIPGNEVLVKCLTQPSYIRLGGDNSDAVTAANGYYMAVGDEVRWQTSRRANRLYYIRATGSDGALSVAFGVGD
jgi:hypothetical protein